MKIAYISQTFPPHELGGADLTTYRISNAMKRREHMVYVICAEDISNPSIPAGEVKECFEPYDDIPVFRLSYNWHTMPDPYWSIYGINDAVENIILKRLENIKPDIVHIISVGMVSAAALTASKKSGTKAIYTLTGKWELCPLGTLLRRDGNLCSGRQNGLTCLWCILGKTKVYRVISSMPKNIQRIFVMLITNNLTISKLSGSTNLIRTIEKRNSIMKEILSNLDVVFSPSKCHIELFSSVGFFDKENVILSPHGRNNKIAFTGSKKTFSNKIRFGYTGQIVPHKGVDTLIAAFNKLTNNLPAELHIFGDPEKDARCKQYKNLSKGNPSITWRGSYQNHSVGDILSTIDVVIVPSNCVENDPGTIAEAFASKTPVIGSDVCGIREHIRHNIDGLLFQRGDPDDLSAQMIRIINEPGLLENLKMDIIIPRNIQDQVIELENKYLELLN